MHKSVYDVLHTQPKLHRKLPREQEALAQAIIASGKMRLDADTQCNYTRLLISKDRIDLTFSLRELQTPALRRHSQKKISSALAGHHDGETLRRLSAEYLELADAQLAKKHPVLAITEIKMARALVLCNAYSVIHLLHLEGAEIFISFGQNVGEVMDVARWEQSGRNSGLQAVGGGENAVYVSCGGHPFLTKDEYRHSGDGTPALARFMIIAAQETGHNGDMLRADNGVWAGRHSAIEWDRAANPAAARARLSDIARTESLRQHAADAGMHRIAEWERHLEFYRKNKLHTWRARFAWLRCKLGWRYLKSRTPLPRLQRDAYPATLLITFFSDMLANLSPQAEVYKRNNPQAEEAIACIEAVARVPQQVVKWGHDAVRMATPGLYSFYYQKIVPACDKSSQRVLQRSKNDE